MDDDLTRIGLGGAIGVFIGSVISWLTMKDKINDMKKSITDIYNKLDELAKDVAFIKGKMNKE